jgi:hypothetical protein
MPDKAFAPDSREGVSKFLNAGGFKAETVPAV